MSALQLLKLRINKSNPSHLSAELIFSSTWFLLNMHTTDSHIDCKQTLTFLSMSKNTNITKYKVHLSLEVKTVDKQGPTPYSTGNYI